MDLPILHLTCDQLRPGDPIFASLRGDYPGFDTWLERCRRERRPALVCWQPGKVRTLAGICILKQELKVAPDLPLDPPCTKISTFKVAPGMRGQGLGTRMMQAAIEAAGGSIFLTAYDHHVEALELFARTGFIRTERPSPSGEVVMVRPAS